MQRQGLAARPFALLHPGPAPGTPAAPPWRADGGDLVTDPGVYVVTVQEAGVTLRGLAVGLVLADSLDASGLLPHEQTLERTVRRRRVALERARVDREPVMLVHRGSGSAVAVARRSAVPLFAVTDPDVRVDIVADAADRAGVLADLSQRRCLVADGHHRLAAALRAGDTARRMVTALVVDSDDTAPLMGPVHRLARRKGRALSGAEVVDRVLGLAGSGSSAEMVDPRQAVAGGTVVVGAGDRWQAVAMSTDSGFPTAAHLVEEALRDLNADVTRSADVEAARVWARGRNQVSLLLPALTPAAVTSLAAEGVLLPPKATSFRPKLPPGLLLRRISAAGALV